MSSLSLTRPAQWWAIGAGIAVTMGPALPFVSQRSVVGLVAFEVSSAVLTLSVLFGLALIGAAVLTGLAPWRRTATVLLLVGGILGTAGYLLFLVLGQVGMPRDVGFGITVRVHWWAGPGLVLSLLGSLAAAIAAAVDLGALASPRRVSRGDGS